MATVYHPVELHSQIPPAQLADALARLTPANLPKAISAAVNRTAETVRTRVRRATAAQLGLKQKDAKRIALVKSSATSLTAKLIVGRRRFALTKLGAVQTATGVDVPGGQSIPHAFVKLMPNGHVGVFLRKGKARLPIQELTAPSLAETAISTSGLLDSEMAAAAPILEKNMRSQVERFLAKQAADLSDS